jgi:hypothetical protein
MRAKLSGRLSGIYMYKPTGRGKKRERKQCDLRVSRKCEKQDIEVRDRRKVGVQAMM